MDKKLLTFIAVLAAVYVVCVFVSQTAMANEDMQAYSYKRCLPLFQDFEGKSEVFADFSKNFCSCSSSQTHKYLQSQNMEDAYEAAMKIEVYSQYDQQDKITPKMIKSAAQSALIETYYHHRCFVYTIEESCKTPTSDVMKKNCACYLPHLRSEMKKNIESFDFKGILKSEDLAVLLTKTKAFNDSLTSYNPDYAENCQ